jgi:hypothetical protein
MRGRYATASAETSARTSPIVTTGVAPPIMLARFSLIHASERSCAALALSALSKRLMEPPPPPSWRMMY